jgi:hypothetical protein
VDETGFEQELAANVWEPVYVRYELEAEEARSSASGN